MNSCGSTCSTSRSSGRLILRAASIAWRTSSRSMSRARLPSVTPAREFSPRTWLPATPMRADSTGTPETPSASSTERRIELTVESRLTMAPLRSPFDSAAPSARNFTRSSASSAMSTHVLVLPMSSPTRYLSFFDKRRSCRFLPSFLYRHMLAASAGIRIQNYLASVLQIHGLHATGIRLPLRKIFDQHAIFPGELAGTQVQRDGLRNIQAGETGHDDTQVMRIGEVNFADKIGRARTD